MIHIWKKEYILIQFSVKKKYTIPYFKQLSIIIPNAFWYIKNKMFVITIEISYRYTKVVKIDA
jgi:hypothetical protein